MSELSARGKALERVIKEAAQAAEARMREPMGCGHPRACWVEEEGYESGGPQGWIVTKEGGCIVCQAITKARAAERERIEQVIRNCCVAITAETLVRAIRRGGGE